MALSDGRRRRVVHRPTIDELLALLASGLSQAAIWRRYGVGQPTIHEWLKKAGKTATYEGHRANRHEDTAEPESYRILHPTVAKLVALKPFPRLRLTSGRRY